MADQDQHIYHHNDNDGAKVNVSFEKNSKGYNFSATVVGASSVEEAMKLLFEANKALAAEFGTASS